MYPAAHETKTAKIRSIIYQSIKNMSFKNNFKILNMKFNKIYIHIYFLLNILNIPNFFKKLYKYL